MTFTFSRYIPAVCSITSSPFRTTEHPTRTCKQVTFACNSRLYHKTRGESHQAVLMSTVVGIDHLCILSRNNIFEISSVSLTCLENSGLDHLLQRIRERLTESNEVMIVYFFPRLNYAFFNYNYTSAKLSTAVIIAFTSQKC